MNLKAKKNNLAAKNRQILVLYVPVIHEGYRRFFARFPKTKELWLISRELAYELRALKKDVRALKATEIKKILHTWAPFKKIEILTPKNLSILQKTTNKLIFANDEISRHLTRKYFTENQVIFDTTFLMWDKKTSLRKNELQEYITISSKKFDQKIMQLAKTESTRSDDWWRQVGGVILKNGRVLLQTHNQHLPTEYQAYYEGDPRANFHRGKCLELSTAIHAEAYLIAQAAKLGISLEGTDLYITTFPCPVCAKQIAYSGIKRVFFQKGYSMLDGEKILKANDIELIRVQD